MWMITNQDGYMRMLEGSETDAQQFAIDSALQYGTDMLLVNTTDPRDDVYLVTVTTSNKCTLATIEHISA